MGYAAVLLGALLSWAVGGAACDPATECHYGAHHAAVTGWLVDTWQPPAQWTPTVCTEVPCADRRVALLLSHRPAGCSAAIRDRWELLHQMCSSVGGICCSACGETNTDFCDPTVDAAHHYYATAYAVVATFLVIVAAPRPAAVASPAGRWHPGRM